MVNVRSPGDSPCNSPSSIQKRLCAHWFSSSCSPFSCRCGTTSPIAPFFSLVEAAECAVKKCAFFVRCQALPVKSFPCAPVHADSCFSIANQSVWLNNRLMLESNQYIIRHWRGLRVTSRPRYHSSASCGVSSNAFNYRVRQEQ